jgi:peptide/nickel transport system permease protein
MRATGAGWRARRGPVEVELEAQTLVAPPRARWYVLGTDGLGRDLLARLLRAARHSVLVAAAAVLLASWIGVVVGAFAGLGGRWRDGALMRAADTLLALPRLLVYLLCAALFGPSTGLVILVVGLTTWPGLARLVRASARTTRGHEAVLAARAAGCSTLRLALLHVLPAAAPVIAVTAALRFADVILLESALSFLGLGSPPPAVSLGAIVASGRGVLASAWWISVAPGIVLALLVLSVRQLASRLVALADPASVA